MVIRVSFEASDEMFVSLYTLVEGLLRKISRVLRAQKVEEPILEKWNRPSSEQFPFGDFKKYERIVEEYGLKFV